MSSAGRLIGAGLGLVLIFATSLGAWARTPPVSSTLQTAGEFAGCKWERVTAGKFAVASFNCDKAHGNQHLIGDDALPGFWLTDDGGARRLAIQLFSKPPKASIATVLPRVRAASKGPQTSSCVMVYSAAESQGRPQHKRYVLQPTGPALKAWQTAQDNGEAEEQPCGRLGVTIVGDRYFEIMPGNPQTVMFVDMGSEIQIFDPATLRRDLRP
jgi:hypothetical protein